MARRRQLEPPSPEALEEIEEGFAHETSRARLRMPIADVAGEAASLASPLPPETRAEQARDKTDAETFRAAEKEGRIARLIPVGDIHSAGISRDRMQVDQAELMELANSIVSHGLRLPIEVYRAEGDDTGFTLISGYRRLEAYRHLLDLRGDDSYAEIPAFVRRPNTAAEVYVAMVEENEMRVGLSQYERGRAAALAVHDGIFPTLDEAVQALFGSASKAKRSKIRSFAMIHEDLGDMLDYATDMNERQCLRLASALRAGMGQRIREALELAKPENAAGEWAELEPFVQEAEGIEPDPSRGGRPKSTSTIKRDRQTELANGMWIEKESGPNGFAIRFHGPVTDDMIEECMARIEHLLDKI